MICDSINKSISVMKFIIENSVGLVKLSFGQPKPTSYLSGRLVVSKVNVEPCHTKNNWISDSRSNNCNA